MKKSFLIILNLFFVCCSLLADSLSYYRNLGNHYSDLQSDSALIFIEKGLKLANTQNDSFFIGEFSSRKGTFHYTRSNFSAAIKNYLTAEGIFYALNDSFNLAQTKNYIGLFYAKHNEVNKAIQYYNASIDLLKILDSTFHEAGVLNNLGVCYEMLGQEEKALEIYYESLNIKLQLKDSFGAAYNYENLAGILVKQKNYSLANDYLLKALSIKKNYGNEWSYAITLNNMGEFLLDQRKYEEALIYFWQSIEICNKLQFKDLNNHSQKLASECYENMHMYDKALGLFKLHAATKDSIFNESKSKEIGKLEAQFEIEKQQQEQSRLQKEELRLANESKNRKDNLQYSGIFIFVLILFALVFMSGKFSLSEKLAEGLIFFTFLLFFEFLLVLLDPLIDQWSNVEPALKLLINAALAGLIFPIHAFFEENLKRTLTNRVK